MFNLLNENQLTDCQTELSDIQIRQNIPATEKITHDQSLSSFSLDTCKGCHKEITYIYTRSFIVEI